ncbi:MAG: hypothetical protein WAW88_06040 [Nocardioides sp.]
MTSETSPTSAATAGTMSALRAQWSADPTAAAELDEACAPQKTCKNMRDVSFEGFAETGGDLRTAWRATLAREGKLAAPGQSIRDLVLGDQTS